ncbi:hypothetical protein [Mycolicibacterium llatzerense]|uniref:hypothetical protein n=1 Tax=Mycolicibacterium llatzerense TaxID=280871 RepID=UPI0021B5F513|nr:hypothetical protein [Mycolicibacterium llatzerense]MCT7372948.1 hypothetical protein [Mycolicibacterium llatzerense]
MSAYWVIATIVFTVLWVAMAWTVCTDAADGAGLLALSFIPLFTMGVVLVAIVWPLAVAVLVIGALVSLAR